MTLEMKDFELGGDKPKTEKSGNREDAVKNTLEVYNKILHDVTKNYIEDGELPDEESMGVLYELVRLSNMLQFGSTKDESKKEGI